MSTAPQQQAQAKVMPVKSNGSLEPANQPDSTLALHGERIRQINHVLQTSLNVEDILSHFNRELQDIVPHDHLGYINEKLNLNLTIGKRARHACTYDLTINEDRLGLICLTRNKAFSDTEIATIENCICAIHYPLRNALMYYDALNAAHKDPLTGIGNRAAMSGTLHREIELAFRHNRHLGLIMMDVDHFKKVNDVYGHAAGDYVLQTLVECADASVRISDALFRYGGEEFVIILPETDEAGVLRLAKRIRRRVEKLEALFQQQMIQVTVSLGITNLRESDDEKTLLARADDALYKAKRDGRNCIRIAT